MQTFNFDGFSDIKAPNNTNYLTPWAVYDMVSFDGIGEPVTGNRKDGGTWRAWDFKFSCPKGTYSERIFEPDENGVKRRTVTNANGHESELPSDFERSLQVVAQIVAAYNPKGFEKLKTIAPKLKTFEQFIGTVKKLLENPLKPSEEHNIQMKLDGRKDNTGRQFARLPNCGISKTDGKPFMEKFIGENVLLTAWELRQKEAYEKTTPSDPEKTNPIEASVDGTDNIPSGEGTEEITDIDGLLDE